MLFRVDAIMRLSLPMLLKTTFSICDCPLPEPLFNCLPGVAQGFSQIPHYFWRGEYSKSRRNDPKQAQDT